MRQLIRGWKILTILVAIVAAAFHYYCAGFGSPEPRVFRGMHMLLLLPMVFILFPATKRSPQNRPSVFDLIFAVICFVACGYTVVQADRLNHHFIGVHEVLPIEVVLGGLLAVLSLEAVRRSLSKYFAVTVALILSYLFTCQYFTGAFHYKAFSLARAVEILYMPNDDGMFGFLTGISADILYVYIIFAGVMTMTGAGAYLIDFSTWLAGGARGGPAKVAVISSALYGTVSGSTVANVYATGSFTIPMMKQTGYKPREAAAVEAISGVGGQIMPPIMGAGSFIMAEVTGVPYFTIIKVAVIPALLYYLGVMTMVHLIALKRNAQSMPKDQRPSMRRVLRGSYFFIPFLTIVILLATGYSPSKAAFHTIWITLVLSFFNRKTWPTPRKVIDTLIWALCNGALIAAVLAGAGMVLSVLTRTGVALSFSSIVVSASHGMLLLAMLLIFVIVSILGTGIPTTAAYVIGVTVGAMSLGDFGVPILAAHLFVFYYSVLADMTPPDAVTTFAAANLAGSEPMITGLEGFKLGIAGFLVPFAFIYNPELLLQGSALQIALSFAMTALGVICLGAGIVGHLFGRLMIVQRLLFFTAAGCLIYPGRAVDWFGVGLVVLGGFWSYLTKEKTALSTSPNRVIDTSEA